MHDLKFQPGAVEGGTGSLGEPRGGTCDDLNEVWHGFHGKRKHQEAGAWVSVLGGSGASFAAEPCVRVSS